MAGIRWLWWAWLPLLVVISWTRALNFDEWLTIRVGWLLFTDYENGFFFGMPLMAVAGAFAHAFEDPAVVVHVLRLGILALVIGTLTYVLPKIYAGPQNRALWLLIVFSNGGFLTHTIEARYDCVLVLGYLLCTASAWDFRSPRPIALGVGLFALASHHVKGLMLASGFIAAFLVLLRLSRVPFRAREHLAIPAGVCIALSASWLGLAYAFGFAEDVIGLYVQFPRLSRQMGMSNKWGDLVARLSADWGWWALALLLLAIAAPRLMRKRRLLLRVGLFGGVPLIFTLSHPHPWAYSVIYHVPFVAFLLVPAMAALRAGAHRMWQRKSVERLITWFVPALLLATVLPECVRMLRTPAAPQLAFLRYARAVIRDDQSVVDPVGYLYFTRAPDPEWYSAALLSRLAQQGTWQSQSAKRFESADFLVASYRVGFLPPRAERVLERRFVHLCGPLFIAHDEAPTRRIPCRAPNFRLMNYW
jgi:hypothetical protein